MCVCVCVCVALRILTADFFFLYIVLFVVLWLCLMDTVKHCEHLVGFAFLWFVLRVLFVCFYDCVSFWTSSVLFYQVLLARL